MNDIKLKRVGNGPILEPRKDVPWEKDAVLNCAAYHDGNRFHLFYRAVAHNPGDPNRSSIGYAWSDDGIHFERLNEPILRSNECPEEKQGVEDPRITEMDGVYHLLYTAYDGSKTQVARATSIDLVHWDRRGICFSHTLMGDNKDAALLPDKVNGRYCLIHRPSGQVGTPDMWLSYSDDLVNWDGHTRFMKTLRRDADDWEYEKIGLAGTPHRTKAGWLAVYHAVDRKMIYRLGLVLLDGNDPARIIRRTDNPILQPESEWELAGDVNNVVFSCGSVLIGTELWVYYGGADTVIGLAKCDVEEFI